MVERADKESLGLTFGRYLCVVLLLFSVAVCATGPQAGQRKDVYRPSLYENEPPGQPKKGVSRLACNSINLKTLTGEEIPVIEVRLANPAEISNVFPNNLFSGFATGTAFGAIGVGVVMLNPMAQGAGLAPIFLPVLTIVGASNARDRSTIAPILEQMDMAERIKQGIVSRLSKDEKKTTDGRYRLEIVLIGYGLFGDGINDTLCFSLDAEMSVWSADERIYKDQILMEPMRRSIDAPPPRCASLGKFAAERGRLARETLIEAGEVVSAMVVKRISGTKENMGEPKSSPL